MLTQVRYTTDNEGDCLQIAVKVLNDFWEPLCFSYVDVGPFDDPEVLEAELVRRMKSHARIVMSEAPHMVDRLAQDPLPFR